MMKTKLVASKRLVFFVQISVAVVACSRIWLVSPLATPTPIRTKATTRPFELEKSSAFSASALQKEDNEAIQQIICKDDGTLASLFGSQENLYTFFQRYFGTRCPVHIHRSDFGQGLFDTPHSTLHCLKMDDLQELFESSDYVTLREHGMPKPVDKSTMEWNDFHAQISCGGCSAVIPVVHEKAFRGLKQSLETTLGSYQGITRTVSMTVYHSGPNASALLPHTDGYDVLVVQMEGCKDWDIVQGYKESRRQTRLTLQPGDVLYIPYNVIHSAQTTPGFDVSTHLTIGLLTGSGWTAQDTLHYANHINNKNKQQ